MISILIYFGLTADERVGSRIAVVGFGFESTSLDSSTTGGGVFGGRGECAELFRIAEL